jgi:hyperosmotically inducible protein
MKSKYNWLAVLLLGAAVGAALPASGFAKSIFAEPSVAKSNAANPGQSKNAAPQSGSSNYQSRLAEEVRHQLVLIPFLSVFDNLQYSVNGGEVTLSGWVTNGAVKDDAGSAVKHIEGVTKVNNNIQLLPVSPMDDQIRRAEFRAIYGEPALEKYASGSLLPIHIIVNGGHVTLEGYVISQSDKDLVNIKANSVPNVFSVTNNLKVMPGR